MRKFVWPITAAVAGLWLPAISTSAYATSFTYNGFSNTSGLTLAGNAATTTTGDGTVLRLTPASSSQAGAAYSTSAVALGASDTFSTQFQFRFTSPGGADPADGITFVVAKNPSGLGGQGNGIGYSGVGNSVAIEFDTYNNGNAHSLGRFPAEPDSSNHVAIDTGGTLTDTDWSNVYGNGSCGFSGGTPSQNSNTAAGCMSNGQKWTANISYDGSKLNVSLKDPSESAVFDAISNYPINLNSYLGTNTAYVGFTASTGAGWENHDIVNWEFASTTQFATTPLPAALPLFAGGLGVMGLLGWRRKRKQAAA